GRMKSKRTKPSRSPRADATHCVHAGEERHGRNAPLATEIVQTSVFAIRDVEELRRYVAGKSNAYLYTRYSNPTIVAAEQKIAALEGAEGCVITSSGTSAVMVAVLAACRAGDEILSSLDLYGGTLKLFEEVLPRLGIRPKLVPFGELGKIERYFSKRTRMLWLETPTNPVLRCVDIRSMAEIARRHGVVLVVDNTMATPILQKPLALGADLVVHSATKYLGGHSDVTAGAIAGSAKLVAQARKRMLQSGGSLDPGAAYLLLRGLKTLSLRVERACRNSSLVAEALRQHPKVARVMYPGLAEHEGHEVAERQMADFGMMVSFDMRGDIRGGGKAAERFINGLKLWYLAASFGGVESTVSYPVLTSHVHMKAARLRQLGVSPATVRLSVGIEEAEDLIADITQALAKA
ncbi:MAG: trans-sulfuration enzyme family protein, partial [Terriglobales bacterium]